MLYRYQAKTKDGLISKKGEVEAASPQIARKLLQDSGLIVFSLVPARKSGSISDFISKIMGITITDKVRFTEQLASMIVAGLPLTKALDLLVTQTKNPNMVDLVKQALADVEAGNTLSSSLGKNNTVFSKSYLSLVRAGEASGQLGKLLQRLANNLDKQRQFQARVKGALIYPVIVVVAMIAVFIIVVVFVIPQMADMYKSLDVELPFATVALIAISNFIINYWYVCIISVVVGFFTIRGFASTKTGVYFFANLAFKLPIFGNLNKQAGLVDFTGTLALLLEAGVPIIECLEIVKDSAGNVLYKDAIERFIDDIKKGFPLSVALSKEENFPNLVSQMVVVGEETGTLGERLQSLSAYYEDEVDKIVKNLSTAMEPFIIVVLGVMVAVLVFAVITPIYGLISDL